MLSNLLGRGISGAFGLDSNTATGALLEAYRMPGDNEWMMQMLRQNVEVNRMSDPQYGDQKRKEETMEQARQIDSIDELIGFLESDLKDDYLRGAYYCRMVELQSTLSPVGRLIADRYVEKFREVV
jgi:hypothetical protein